MLWCLWGKAEIDHIIDRAVFEVGYHGQIVPDPSDVIVKQVDLFYSIERTIANYSSQDDPF